MTIKTGMVMYLQAEIQHPSLLENIYGLRSDEKLILFAIVKQGLAC